MILTYLQSYYYILWNLIEKHDVISGTHMNHMISITNVNFLLSHDSLGMCFYSCQRAHDVVNCCFSSHWHCPSLAAWPLPTVVPKPNSCWAAFAGISFSLTGRFSRLLLICSYQHWSNHCHHSTSGKANLQCVAVTVALLLFTLHQKFWGELTLSRPLSCWFCPAAIQP